MFRPASTAVRRTFRDWFLSFPRGIIIQQHAKGDLYVRMPLSYPVENLRGFWEGQDYEQVLGFAVWSPSHCDGGSKMGEA